MALAAFPLWFGLSLLVAGSATATVKRPQASQERQTGGQYLNWKGTVEMRYHHQVPHGTPNAWTGEESGEGSWTVDARTVAGERLHHLDSSGWWSFRGSFKYDCGGGVFQHKNGSGSGSGIVQGSSGLTPDLSPGESGLEWTFKPPEGPVGETSTRTVNHGCWGYDQSGSGQTRWRGGFYCVMVREDGPVPRQGTRVSFTRTTDRPCGHFGSVNPDLASGGWTLKVDLTVTCDDGSAPDQKWRCAGSTGHPDEEERNRIRDLICDGVAPNVAMHTGINGLILEGFKTGARAARRLAKAGFGAGLVSLGCSVTDPRPASNSRLRKACRGLGATSTVLGALALTPDSLIPKYGWAKFVVTGVGSLVTGGASTLACWADPPDANFETIAKPEIENFALPKRARKRIPKRAQGPVVALVRNGEAIRATGRAFMHCEDRAAGAHEAGDEVWEARQLECAEQYAGELATLLGASKRVRKRLAKALRKTSVPNRIPRRPVRKQLRKGPRHVRQSLRSGGASPEQIEWAVGEVNESLKRVRIPKRLSALVAGREILQALDQAAQGFREVAEGYR